MPKPRGKQPKVKASPTKEDLVGSITEKLKRLGEMDDIDQELGDSFGVLTEEEVEMFLMDALWVNERLHDYTATVESEAMEEEAAGVDSTGLLDIEWSEDEEDLTGVSFEEKIPMPKSTDSCPPLPPINSYSKPPRKAWDLPVLNSETLNEVQVGVKPLSHEIKQT